MYPTYLAGTKNTSGTATSPIQLTDSVEQEMRDGYEQNLMDEIGFEKKDELFAEDLVKAEDSED